MATTVDTLLVRIESDMKDVRRDLRTLQNDTKKTTKSMQSSMQSFGRVATAVLGSVFVAQIARGSIALTNFASDIEEMQDMSAAVFGSFVGQVRKDLSEFADVVGRSSFELEGLAANVQDTFVPMGFARGEAAKLSVDLVKLATDVGSFKNVATSEVMASFTSALVGNHETLRRYGIVIDQAALQTELYRMGITKNVLAVDQATKIQARLNLIYAGTADAQGNAADTASSYANLVNAMNAELAEFGVELGQKTLPQMKEFVKTVTSMVGGTRELLKAIGFLSDTNDLSLADARDELSALEEKIASWSFAMEKTPALTKFYTNEIKKLAPEVLALRARIAELTPVIEKETEAKDKNIVKTKEMIDAEKSVTKALDSQKFATQQAKEEMLGMSSAHLKANETMKGLTAITKEQAIELLALIQQEEKYTAQLEANTKAKEDAAAADEKISDTIKQLAQDNQILALEKTHLSDVEKKLEEQRIIMGGLDAQQEAQLRRLLVEHEELNKVITDSTAANEAYNAQKEEGARIAEGFASEESKLREQLEAVNLAMRSAATEDMPLYQAAIDGLNQKIKETNPQFKAMKEAAEKAADAVADSLADAFVEGELSMDSFKDIFKNFIKDLIKQAIKAAIIKHILGPIFGGGFAGGGSVNMGNTTLSHAGGGSISRYGRAGGGMAMPTLVGERGPELFVPHTAGVIRNNHDTKNMMGGGSPTVVNQNINIDAGVSQTVRAEVMSMIPMIKSETINAMIDGKRRGNSVSKAFA